MTPDNILVTSGAQEALFISLRSLVKPGDEILVPDPGYRLLEPLAQLGEGVVVPVSTSADNFEIKAEQFESALTGQSRYLVVLSPNPATCRVVSRNEFEKLLALAEQRNLLILFDAALSKGIYDTTAGPDFSTGLAERVILIGSLSKLYRMSGWRIGWIAGSAAHLKPLRDLKQALSICSASISQWAVSPRSQDRKNGWMSNKPSLCSSATLCSRALRANKISFVQPDSAFYLWLDIRRERLVLE